MTHDEIISMSDQYLMSTYARFPVVAMSGNGACLKDADGNEYIDMGSGIGVNALGYCDPDWQAAVSTQAGKMTHCSNYFYNEPAAKLAKKIVESTGLNKVFFGNSGAEANEGAIKLARKYSCDKYGDGRSTVITLTNSFHGRTITTLTATGQDVFHQYFDPFTGGFRYAKTGDMESLLSTCDETVCAIIIEGVQGEGGVIEIPDSYIKEIYELCQERDWLLIFDEIQTGVGRTGKPYSYMYFDIKPDIVTLAKALGGGLPIGAFVCGEKCKDTFGPSHHGSTFGANPIACAGGCVVLDKVLKDDFLEDVMKKGEHIRKTIMSWNSPFVEAVRGKGLMLGTVLKGVSSKEVAFRMVEKGILPLTAGPSVLRFLPPLNISLCEIDSALSKLKEALEELKNEKAPA